VPITAPCSLAPQMAKGGPGCRAQRPRKFEAPHQRQRLAHLRRIGRRRSERSPLEHDSGGQRGPPAGPQHAVAFVVPEFTAIEARGPPPSCRPSKANTLAHRTVAPPRFGPQTPNPHPPAGQAAVLSGSSAAARPSIAVSSPMGDRPETQGNVRDRFVTRYPQRSRARSGRPSESPATPAPRMKASGGGNGAIGVLQARAWILNLGAAAELEEAVAGIRPGPVTIERRRRARRRCRRCRWLEPGKTLPQRSLRPGLVQSPVITRRTIAAHIRGFLAFPAPIKAARPWPQSGRTTATPTWGQCWKG